MFDDTGVTREWLTHQEVPATPGPLPAPVDIPSAISDILAAAADGSRRRSEAQ